MTNMTIFETEAIVDEHNHLQIDVPNQFPPGSRIRVWMKPTLKPIEDMTEEELDAELAQPWIAQNLTAGEISASGTLGAWDDLGITDSLEYLQALRLEQQKARGLE